MTVATTAIQAADSATAVAATAIQAVDSQTAVVAVATTNLNNAQTALTTVTAAVDSQTAVVAVDTTNVATTKAAADVSVVETVVNGVKATAYAYSGSTATPLPTAQTTPLSTTTVPYISASWGSGQVLNSGRVDNVIVKYEGTITVPDNAVAVKYAVYSDDGAKLYLDGVLAINNWKDQGPTWSAYSPTYNTTTDKSQDFILWYYEHGGGANVTLGWGLTFADGTGYWTNPGATAFSTVTTTKDPVLVAAAATAKTTLTTDTTALNTLIDNKTAATAVVVDKTQIKAIEVTLLTQLTDTATATVATATDLANVASTKANEAKTALESAVTVVTQVVTQYVDAQLQAQRDAEAAALLAAQRAAAAEAARLSAIAAQPAPAPEPAPAPAPDPTPVAQPDPAPQTPQDVPTEDPAPPVPAEDAPTPVAEPDPAPVADPTPEPAPEPQPAPAVDETPNPEPDPAPQENIPADNPDVPADPQPAPAPDTNPTTDSPEPPPVIAISNDTTAETWVPAVDPETYMTKEDIKSYEEIGIVPNNADQLPTDVPKPAPAEALVAHVQIDVPGVENGGIQFFGTQSQPQVVGEDGNLTPPPPPPGSGLPIPEDAITLTDTFIGQPGGTTFNAPDVAVPVVLVPVEIPAALDILPGAGAAVQAVNQAYVALANIGNDMSPITRKKAKKILVLTTVIAAVRRRFGN